MPLFKQYCADCHMKENPEAGIALDQFTDQAAAMKGGRTWLRVRDALQGRIMPPADEAQPSLEELDRLIAWIENDFLAAQCGQQGSAAPVVIRRLNRQEYDNTIRDLLGLDLHLADGFPADDIGFGFDNVGSALNLSPVHIEKYLDAGPSGTVLRGNGHLLFCDNKHKAILDLSPQGVLGVVADQYDGKPLRSLNDLTVDARGNVYWTDPADSSDKNPIGDIFRVTPKGEVSRPSVKAWT